MSSELDKTRFDETDKQQRLSAEGALEEEFDGDGQFDDDEFEDEEEFEDYRSLSSLAVVALIIGVISPLAFIAPAFILVPLVAVVLGVLAIRQVRRERDYYTGGRLAVFGIVLATLMATTAGAFHTVWRVLTLPPGYEEISYWDLQPDPEHPESPIPPSILELDGKKVFVRGFVYPGMQQKRLKNFTLVRDFMSCCFGDQPKLTDMIQVTLAEPFRVNVDYRRRGLGGILRVHRELKATDLTGVYYELEADYLK